MGKIKGDITLRGLRVREAPGHEILEDVLFPWTDVHIMVNPEGSPSVAWMPVMWRTGPFRQRTQLGCTLTMHEAFAAFRAQQRAVRLTLREPDASVSGFRQRNMLSPRGAYLLCTVSLALFVAGIALVAVGNLQWGPLCILFGGVYAAVSIMCLQRAMLKEVARVTATNLEFFEETGGGPLRYDEIRAISEKDRNFFALRLDDMSTAKIRLSSSAQLYALKTIFETRYPGIVCDWHDKKRQHWHYVRPLIVSFPIVMAILLAFHLWVTPLPARAFFGMPLMLLMLAMMPWLLRWVLKPLLALDRWLNKRKRVKTRARAALSHQPAPSRLR